MAQNIYVETTISCCLVWMNMDFQSLQKLLKYGMYCKCQILFLLQMLCSVRDIAIELEPISYLSLILLKATK